MNGLGRDSRKKLAYLHVAQFVSDGEGGAESVVLDDGTRRGAVAHCAQFGQAERVALLQVRIAANVLPANNNFIHSHFD